MSLMMIIAPTPLAAQSGVVFRPDPAEFEIGVGQVETINIIVENIKNLYGGEVHLKFDPAIVEVVDADPNKDGVQVSPGTFPQPDFIAANKADNKAGTIDYAATSLNPTPPSSGSGIMLSIQFRGKVLGKKTKLTSKGNLLAVLGGSQQVTSVPFKWEDGALAIVSPKPPTPTPTRLATPTRLPTDVPIPVATQVPAQVVNTPSRSSNGDLTPVDIVLILIGCGGCLGTVGMLGVAAFLILRKSKAKRSTSVVPESAGSREIQGS